MVANNRRSSGCLSARPCRMVLMALMIIGLFYIGGSLIKVKGNESLIHKIEQKYHDKIPDWIHSSKPQGNKPLKDSKQKSAHKTGTQVRPFGQTQVKNKSPEAAKNIDASKSQKSSQNEEANKPLQVNKNQAVSKDQVANKNMNVNEGQTSKNIQQANKAQTANSDKEVNNGQKINPNRGTSKLQEASEPLGTNKGQEVNKPVDLTKPPKLGIIKDTREKIDPAENLPGSPKSSIGEEVRKIEEKPNGERKIENSKTESKNVEKVTSAQVHNKMTADEEKEKRPPKVGRGTILYGNLDPMYIEAARTVEEHCKRHNYRYEFVNLESDLYQGIWSQAAFMMSLILKEMEKSVEERLDWIFYMDMDALVLNPEVPLDVFLPPDDLVGDKINAIVVDDHNGLNLGTLFLRVCPWSLELLSAVIAFPFYRPSTVFHFQAQGAMDIILKERGYMTNVVRVPREWINPYAGDVIAEKGFLQVHFPGSPQKVKDIEIFLRLRENEPQKWSIPYEKTFYPEAIKSFWNNFNSTRS